MTEVHVAVLCNFNGSDLRGDTFQAWATLPDVGKVVVGTGRSEWQAADSAARFFAGNYPDTSVTFEGLYQGNPAPPMTSSYWRIP